MLVYRILKNARRLSNANVSAVAWLEAAAALFSKMLVDTSYLSSQENHLFAESVEAMKADIKRNDVDLATPNSFRSRNLCESNSGTETFYDTQRQGARISSSGDD